MDNYSGREKFQAPKNQKTYKNRSFRPQDDEYQDRERRDRNMEEDYYENKKTKKPEQTFYDSRPGSSTSKMRYEKSYEPRNRETRQTSEPRVAANNFTNNHETSKTNFINTDRNRDMTRDTRSVEPAGANSYDRNKPPSGQQRISNSLINRLPAKIDQLAPRFKKKLLLENGLSLELLDKNISEITQQQQLSSSWSNTLPAGGRGRNNHRYDNSQTQKYHQQQQNQYQNHHYQVKYNQNQYYDYDNKYRSLTPPPSIRIQHQQHHQQQNQHQYQQNQQHQQHQQPHQQHLQNQHQQQQQQQQQHHHHQHHHHQQYHQQQNQTQEQRYDCKPNKNLQNDEFTDWSEEVLNSQSMPLDVNINLSNKSNVHQNKSFEDGQMPRNHRRRRNRSTSSNRSVENRSNSGSNHFEKNSFKIPYAKQENNKNINTNINNHNNNNNQNRQRKNSQSSSYSRETSMERSFKAHDSRENSLDRRHRRNSRFNGGSRRGSDYQSSRENSTERYGNWSRNESPINSRDRDGRSWRREDEIPVNNSNTGQEIAELTKQFVNCVDLNKAGVLVLNQNQDNQRTSRNVGTGQSHEVERQRTLFDPSNPDKPIVVTHSQNRPKDLDRNVVADASENYNDNQHYLSATKPIWYNKTSDQYNVVHNKLLIDSLEKLDDELLTIIDNGDYFKKWENVQLIRDKIQKIFEDLLRTEMKFCQQEHIEHYFWKLLYYKIIELLRKKMDSCDETQKIMYKEKILEIIDHGTKHLESLLILLETSYKFSMEQFVGANAAMYRSGLGYVGLALVSAQKLFLFLGDLARYREQINQTNNFGRAKNFYVKAQQIVPKNGRPYNQLALLAVYSKRKIDAVYFYMRSLMSSNPFYPAKESLVALFDEIRKKYESSQRKREEKNRLGLKEKEHRFDGNLRKETWIHPEDGCRVHRTAPLDPSMIGQSTDSSDEEELRQLDPSELNKRFITSFLHIQGKLITKIGMESFQMCSIQMLREFRALLHHSPIAISSHRLLQLISLNMYAINCTELKDPNIVSFARSEVQECAISIGLLMFGIILERFIDLLRGTLDDVQTMEEEPRKTLTLNEDTKVMLPAIKVWCDWMMFHVKVWNPPPFCSDYKIGTSNHDPWQGLANLMTLLENVDTHREYLSLECLQDFELVRLQEDITLAGFTPLKNNTPEPIFCRCDIDIEIAQNALRLQKLIYFGTGFLCECQQPILKKIEFSNRKQEYCSIVQNRTDSTEDSEIMLESFSDEDEAVKKPIVVDKQLEINGKDDKSDALSSDQHVAEVRKLLRRKDELERRNKMDDRYNERLQDILSQSTVALHIEVRPKYLIPDTNCFVDDLNSIRAIANAHPLYQLMIPIIVINELEGLSRGIKPLHSSTMMVVHPLTQQMQHCSTQSVPFRRGDRNDPNHAAMVAEASKQALSFLKSKNPAVKCVTAKGSILNSTLFTNEDDQSEQKSNDDKILDTALNLCKKNIEEKKGEVRYVVREVVLLTTDRNLRVKALTNELPVRELHDFVKWAGLGIN
ncbi:unnamed protein product [Diamesa serratosioi]